MGYRTFDDVIDNYYDDLFDTNLRFAEAMRVVQEINSLNQQQLHELYLRCLPDIRHNQLLFLANKGKRLNTLVEKICQK